MSIRVFVALLLLVSFPLTSWGLTLDEEKKYGREIYFEIVKSSRLINDPYACFYIGQMGRRLDQAAEIPFPLRITLIHSITPNAFATMGGYVYVTSGLIEMTDTEEELAGVLAHELAHVGKRHISKRMEKEKYLNMGMIAAMLLSALVPGGAAVSQALMAGSMGAAQGISLKYSREDETEADRVGLATAEKAGYNGRGISQFLKKIRAAEPGKETPQYLLTHPYPEDRAIKIESMITLEKNRLDTDLFPQIVARFRILDKQFNVALEETWLKRYEKDPKNPTSAYGASLVYSLKGDVDRAAAIAGEIDSPYRNLFLGEILVRGQRFAEATEVLRTGTDPISRYYYATALEGKGDLQGAATVLKGLFPWHTSFPGIYQKYAMVVGRLGNEGLGFEYLGRYYLETGRGEAARMYFQKAVDAYGRNSEDGRKLRDDLSEMKDGKPKEEPASKQQKKLSGP